MPGRSYWERHSLCSGSELPTLTPSAIAGLPRQLPGHIRLNEETGDFPAGFVTGERTCYIYCTGTKEPATSHRFSRKYSAVLSNLSKGDRLAGISGKGGLRKVSRNPRVGDESLNLVDMYANDVQR